MYKYDEKSNVIINTETAEVIPVNEIFHGMALDMLDSFSVVSQQFSSTLTSWKLSIHLPELWLSLKRLKLFLMLNALSVLYISKNYLIPQRCAFTPTRLLQAIVAMVYVVRAVLICMNTLQASKPIYLSVKP